MSGCFWDRRNGKERLEGKGNIRKVFIGMDMFAIL
jgi:hypothetical protein